ncbi:MAG: DUF4465 domain-containing protein [Bacteroidales bacterium]|nr:DUF4465 domain-containing protein [Bacteroidales bacterium]
MKKITLFLSALMAVGAWAQEESYELRVLTFEDEDANGIVNYNGGVDTWSSLIENVQYGGPMLYPNDFDEDEDVLYGWYDEGNTEIMSELINNYLDGCFWGGGIAISNYIDDNLGNGDYLHQLSVPTSNGSDNFAVVYCNSNPTISEYNPQAYIAFADEAHVIESVNVGPTTYQLNVAKNGNSPARALTEEGDYLTITFYGYNEETQTGSVSFDLARDGSFVEDWTEVSLLPLGKVTMVLFAMSSNDSGTYGVNQASYFAIDDIKVRFAKEDIQTSVDDVESEVVSVEYFSVAGQKFDAPQKGVNIVKKTYSDGTSKTSKVVVK